MGEMIRNLFARRSHRGVHRRRRPAPYSVLPPFDVRLLIPQADPWERFA